MGNLEMVDFNKMDYRFYDCHCLEYDWQEEQKQLVLTCSYMDWETTIIKVDTEEVDFVAMNSKGIVYYQVAASVRDADTLARELRPLHKIN